MIGFVKSFSIIAILLLSATFAYAGELKALPPGATNVHPDGKANALSHVEKNGNETAYDAVDKVKEEKLRRLRPVNPVN